MDVTGSNSKFTHAFAQFINASVIFFNLFYGANVLMNQKHIITRRLDF